MEEVVQKTTKANIGASPIGSSRVQKPILINEVEVDAIDRISTGDGELDRVLGGGIVKGSIVLVGGEPGIGKSTLMLQMAMRFQGNKTLYVSGEESPQQIKIRGERLGEKGECYLLAETQTQNIFKQIEIFEPNLVIIDSIQTMSSAFVDSPPGSISQVRECAAEFMRFAMLSDSLIYVIDISECDRRMYVFSKTSLGSVTYLGR